MKARSLFQARALSTTLLELGLKVDMPRQITKRLFERHLRAAERAIMLNVGNVDRSVDNREPNGLRLDKPLARKRAARPLFNYCLEMVASVFARLRMFHVSHHFSEGDPSKIDIPKFHAMSDNDCRANDQSTTYSSTVATEPPLGSLKVESGPQCACSKCCQASKNQGQGDADSYDVKSFYTFLDIFVVETVETQPTDHYRQGTARQATNKQDQGNFNIVRSQHFPYFVDACNHAGRRPAVQKSEILKYFNGDRKEGFISLNVVLLIKCTRTRVFLDRTLKIHFSPIGKTRKGPCNNLSMTEISKLRVFTGAAHRFYIGLWSVARLKCTGLKQNGFDITLPTLSFGSIKYVGLPIKKGFHQIAAVATLRMKSLLQSLGTYLKHLCAAVELNAKADCIAWRQMRPKSIIDTRSHGFPHLNSQGATV